MKILSVPRSAPVGPTSHLCRTHFLTKKPASSEMNIHGKSIKYMNPYEHLVNF